MMERWIAIDPGDHIFDAPKLPDGDSWFVELSESCLTDILIRIGQDKGGVGWQAMFEFRFGRVVLDVLNDAVGEGGRAILSDDEAALFDRWADQLELYAKLIRSVTGRR